MNKEILVLLRKTLPRVLENLHLVLGHDTTVEEIEEVRESKRLTVRFLENLGDDHFFLRLAEEFGLSDKEGEALDSYLQYKLRKDFEEVRRRIPYIEE